MRGWPFECAEDLQQWSCDTSASEKGVFSGKTELSTTTALDQILANLAKAMVDMLFLCVCFQDLGIHRRLGDPELDFALGR